MAGLLTRKGARNLTETLDRVATAVQNRYDVLGIPMRVAQDFAYRCDLLSDAIERTAATNFPLTAAEGEDEDAGDTDKTAAPEFEAPAQDETGESVDHGDTGFDANAIGDERDGPYQQDADEPYMTDAFSQKRFNELREKLEAGEMAPKLANVDAALDVVLAEDLDSLRKLSASLRDVLAVDPISRLPGLSGMQLRAQIDRIVELRHEIEVITSQYESVLKQLKALEKEEKAGISELRKAAAAMREKGKYLVEAEKGLLQFTAYLTEKRPGIEQMIAKGEQYKGQKAGDFFGRVAKQLGDDVAKAVEAIYDATKEDLTHTTMAVRGFKIVEKTAAFSAEQQKTAGIADIVVSLRDWLAGATADGVARRILNFAGDVKRWVKGFLVRTGIVKKNTEAISRTLGDARKSIDAALAGASKFASDDNDWGFNLTE